MQEAKNVIAVPLAIVVAGALIAGALYLSPKVPSDSQGVMAPDQAKAVKVKAVTNDDHIRGNPEAKVIVVEYSDTQCPFCKNFHNTMNQISTEYGKDGDVAWVYRHFPLDSLHKKARKEAEATECAADLGGNDAFWKYLDEIFIRTGSNDKLDVAELPKIAKDIGLDEAKFMSCLDSGKFAKEVEAQYQSGIEAGVGGTPYSFVVLKGTETVVPINGAQPYNVVKQVIDSLIGKK